MLLQELKSVLGLMATHVAVFFIFYYTKNTLFVIIISLPAIIHSKSMAKGKDARKEVKKPKKAKK
jgi:uncharacterized membrane protein YesL